MSTSTPTPDLSTLRVAAIGAGNMGGPVVRAALAAGVDPAHLQVVNSSPDSSARAAQELGVSAGSSRTEAVSGADVVVLGVKPYQILDVAAEIAPALADGAVLVSLAAGIRLEQIEQVLPEGAAVVRAMPNTPISVGEGVVGLMRGSGVDDAQDALVHALFARAGLVADVTEEQVHAVIGASGSASAFVFAAIEAMIDEAVREGLKRPIATQMVEQTVRGAATMLMESGQHPAVAKGGVMSPGGTTAQGLAAFERAGVRAGLAAAMQAAADASRAMSGQ
jgi:pyrroline-5-carboxylate reductase